MPIVYSIDPSRNRVTLTFTGTITDRELFETFDGLYQNPAHRIGMDELSDLRAVHNVTVTSVGLQALADQTSRLLDQAHQLARGGGGAAGRGLRSRANVRAVPGG